MIVATAGHVDHGKTSLIRNLTGVDTDRLEEEKRRGLSINLGYAYRPLKDEKVLGFIDVPGHHRFINTMISGVSGIDLGMLVVAVDDGAMPQTREHLQVLDLLGVEQYLLVLTKVDMVESSRIDEIERKMLTQLPSGTAAFRISNKDGEGIEQLQNHLDALANEASERDFGGLFRMSVDRSFHIKGSGLVVTGTVSSGSIEVGDSLVLQPQQRTVRVRGIHAHNRKSQRGSSGQRCALNISGDVSRDDIERGDWLAHPESIDPSSRFDVSLKIIPDAPFGIKHMSQVKIHLGAKCFPAKIALLNKSSTLAPGKEALAQIITERPVLCSHGDRFLLRDYGETATLGGGRVLNPKAAGKGRNSADRALYLNALNCDDLGRVAEHYVIAEGKVLKLDELIRAWNWTPETYSVQKPTGVVEVRTGEGRYWLTEAKWSTLGRDLLAALSELHIRNPDDAGVKPAVLQACGDIVDNQAVLGPALSELIQKKEILMIGGLLFTKEFHANRKTGESSEFGKLRAILQRAGQKIPSLAQLGELGNFGSEELRNTIRSGLREKRLVKISEKRVALPENLISYVAVLAALDKEGKDLSVINFRDSAACGRNLAVEILEYFDAVRFTRRAGEHRVIIDKDYLEKL